MRNRRKGWHLIDQRECAEITKRLDVIRQRVHNLIIKHELDVDHVTYMKEVELNLMDLMGYYNNKAGEYRRT